jgi:hypothetical protein
MELHTKKCHKWIDVDFRKIQKQISSNLDYGWRRNMWHKIWLKGEKQIVLHSAPPLHGDWWLLIIVSFAHPNLFNKCSAPPSAFYPLLQLSPSSAPSQPRLLHSVRADAYSFDQGHFWQWRTCWRQGLVYQCRRGGCIFIRPGVFRTTEHLLETRVSLPASPLSVVQAMVIIFYIGFWRGCVGPTLFFRNGNLLPLNTIPHKHQKIHKQYEQFIVGNLVFK